MSEMTITTEDVWKERLQRWVFKRFLNSRWRRRRVFILWLHPQRKSNCLL